MEKQEVTYIQGKKKQKRQRKTVQCYPLMKSEWLYESSLTSCTDAQGFITLLQKNCFQPGNIVSIESDAIIFKCTDAPHKKEWYQKLNFHCFNCSLSLLVVLEINTHIVFHLFV